VILVILVTVPEKQSNQGTLNSSRSLDPRQNVYCEADLLFTVLAFHTLFCSPASHSFDEGEGKKKDHPQQEGGGDHFTS
jgi:hypothetical protein